MLYKWANLGLVASVAGILLNGLCPAAQAKTTTVESVNPDPNGNTISLASIALLLPTRSSPLGSADDTATAIVQHGRMSKPTIALIQPDLSVDKDQLLSLQMLPIGLSIEVAARQVAKWVASELAPGKVFVLSTNTAW